MVWPVKLCTNVTQWPPVPRRRWVTPSVSLQWLILEVGGALKAFMLCLWLIVTWKPCLLQDYFYVLLTSAALCSTATRWLYRKASCDRDTAVEKQPLDTSTVASTSEAISLELTVIIELPRWSLSFITKFKLHLLHKRRHAGTFLHRPTGWKCGRAPASRTILRGLQRGLRRMIAVPGATAGPLVPFFLAQWWRLQWSFSWALLEEDRTRTVNLAVGRWLWL